MQDCNRNLTEPVYLCCNHFMWVAVKKLGNIHLRRRTYIHTERKKRSSERNISYLSHRKKKCGLFTLLFCRTLNTFFPISAQLHFGTPRCLTFE